MSNFVQSIYVTILGMGLVFLSLGALMLIIVALQYLLREQTPLAPASTGAPAVPFELDSDPPAAADEAGISGEVVAAIVVALAVWKQQQLASQPPQTTVVTFAHGSPAWRAQGRLS